MVMIEQILKKCFFQAGALEILMQAQVICATALTIGFTEQSAMPGLTAH